MPHWYGFRNDHLQSLCPSGKEGKTRSEEGRNVERKDEKKKGRMERRKKTALHKQL